MIKKNTVKKHKHKLTSKNSSKKKIKRKKSLTQNLVYEHLEDISHENKPKEIIQAEKEIEKAIFGVKKQRKSFFTKIFNFKKSPKEKKKIAYLIPINSLSKQKDSSKFHEEPNIKLSRLLSENPETFIAKNNQIKVEKILDMAHRARNCLIEFNLEKSKELYIEIIKLYNDLPQHEKSLVYEEIDELYNDRKNAESLNLGK